MASVSGLRSIMEDVAITTANSAGDRWLNLSIGNPAPIPEVIATWQRLVSEAVADGFAAMSCGYGPSRGSARLVDAIAAYFRARYGWPVAAQNVVVGAGSQLLGFIAGAMFAGPGDGAMARIVLPSVPDYTGYQGLCMHQDGIAGVSPVIEPQGERFFRYTVDLEAVQRERNTGMFLVSSPSNPAGRSLNDAELDELIRIAERLDVPLVVDHAYGEPFPRITEAQAAPRWHPRVVNFFTASKAGLPGERIGFAVGDPRYIGPMVSFLANSALHAPQLCQLALATALETGTMDDMTSTVIKPFYQGRRRLGEKLLADSLPDSVNWKLHSSRGGMFCWLWIDHDWFDDNVVYERLKEKRVFVVPGRHFFVDPERPSRIREHATRCIRISLSAAEPDICEGMGRLGETISDMSRGR
jgi:valine--pyruvate aminotransferase